MQNEIKKITAFRGEYFFLSNFYECPIIYDGIQYRNAEAAFQAQKSLSIEKREQFSTMSPKLARKTGRNMFIRKDWENIKVEIMTEIIREKFSQNFELESKLIKLDGVYLEESNNWGDKFWGVSNGEGENNLGKILMKVRDELIDKNKAISNNIN